MLIPLTRTQERSERNFLQPLFERWSSRRWHPQFDPVTIAGAPEWLREAKDPEARPSFKAYGYSFEIDLLWRRDGERRVVELKNAGKYEPIALAEVLHHAHLLELCDTSSPAPVKATVIGNYNPWSRAAIKYLADRNFSQEHLEYLEFDHLREDDRHYLWFDDPFAPWTPSPGVPAALPAEVTQGWDCWSRIDRTDSWVGTRQPIAGKRPLFMEVPFKMVTSIDRAPGEFLVWEGIQPALGTTADFFWEEKFHRYSP